MQNVIIQNAIIQNVIMQNANMQNANVQNAITQNAIMQPIKIESRSHKLMRNKSMMWLFDEDSQHTAFNH